MTNHEIEGRPPRYRDSITAALAVLSSEWESLHKSYQASTNRAHHVSDVALRETVEASSESVFAIREKVGQRISALMRKHALYPWMKSHPGFPKAVHTARILAFIGDPLRFPGRKCENDHHLPEDFRGDLCPEMIYGSNGSESEEVCDAPVGPVRRGTGVRSIWHYFGLHVIDGRLPRKRKGTQCTWNPSARDAAWNPEAGLANQLIRQSVDPWETRYREEKSRLIEERGVKDRDEPENAPGQYRGHLDKIARVIMVKACLGDLFMEWKGLVRAQ